MATSINLGDAHGKGKNATRAAPRHAQLAVNLAGAMATFLLDTFEHNHGKVLHAQKASELAFGSSDEDEPIF